MLYSCEFLLLSLDDSVALDGEGLIDVTRNETDDLVGNPEVAVLGSDGPQLSTTMGESRIRVSTR
jgi:hypothetical protein